MTTYANPATAAPEAPDWRFENRHERFDRMKRNPTWAAKPAFLQPWTEDFFCYQLVRAFFDSLVRGIPVDAIHHYLQAHKYLRAEGWDELQIHGAVRAIAERLRLPADHPERQLASSLQRWTSELAALGRQPADGVQRIDGLTAQEMLGVRSEGSVPSIEPGHA